MASTEAKRWLRLVGTSLVLAILGVALWLVYVKVKHFDLNEVMASAGRIPPWAIWAAVGFTVLNYLVLTSYDLLNVRYLGHAFPLRKIALGSVTSYMISNTFGMLLGGTAVRYRLYSAWGLSLVEVAELIALLGLTFWLGVFALAGLLFVWAPFPIPQVVAPYLPPGGVGTVGWALLLLVAVYLAASALWRKPIRIGHWHGRLPPLRISLYQILISSADITIAGAVMYVLLPAESSFTFAQFLGVYLLGVVFSVITHVPGQLGILDLIIMEFLGTDESVAAALVVYRAIYTFFPLLIASMLLGLHEVHLRRESLGRAVAWLKGARPEPAVRPSAGTAGSEGDGEAERAALVAESRRDD